MKKYILFSIIFFGVLFFARSSWAATYYVDQNNPSASDSNPGAEALPWKTLKKATQTVVAGDTVIVKAGTYIDNVENAHNLTNDGTAGNPITFISSPRLAAIVSDSGAGANYAWSLGVQGESGKNYIVIDGFKFRGGVVFWSSTHITYQNNELTDGHYYASDPSLNWGLALSNSSYCTIRNNYHHSMRNSGDHGNNTTPFMLHQASTYNTIEYNTSDCNNGAVRTVYSSFGTKGGLTNNNTYRYNLALNGEAGFLNQISTDETRPTGYNIYYQNIIKNIGGASQGAAFLLYKNSHHVSIYNNTAYNVNQFIYGSTGSNNVEFYNNIISTTAWTNLIIYPYPNEIFSYANYNLFHAYPSGNFAWKNWSPYATNLADWRTKPGTPDPNSLEASPLFVNPLAGDFHLQSSSPARNSGRNGVTMGAYITGNEVIGYSAAGQTPDTTPPAAPTGVKVL